MNTVLDAPARAGQGPGQRLRARLPTARGALGERVDAALRRLPATDLGSASEASPEDAAVTLWVLQELSYAGFAGVDDSAEWDPALIGLRVRLESDLENRLRDRWPGPPTGADLRTGFWDLVDEHPGSSLAPHVQGTATTDQVLELLRIRSLCHLREADPVSWVVARLPARAKTALAELQYDEYGGGDPCRLRAGMFGRGLEAAGLVSVYGAYVDEAPVEVLEQNAALSLFGLHRRLRGAALGHLAAVEATRSVMSRCMKHGLHRLGLAPEMAVYYDEHEEAEAVHEQLAVRDICGALVEAEPHLEPDVWFGAWTCLDLEARVARYLLDRWDTPPVA